jgi:ribosomal protein S13
LETLKQGIGEKDAEAIQESINQLSQAEDLNEYENLSHRKLVEKTHQVENQVEELETKFEVFKDQVQKLLRNQ